MEKPDGRTLKRKMAEEEGRGTQLGDSTGERRARRWVLRCTRHGADRSRRCAGGRLRLFSALSGGEALWPRVPKRQGWYLARGFVCTFVSCFVRKGFEMVLYLTPLSGLHFPLKSK